MSLKTMPSEQKNPSAGGSTPAAIVASVYRLADPVLETAGLELVHAEYRPEPGGMTLRIYIDKPGGVTVDDCAAFSRELGDLFDVYLRIDASYRLEVSSPGIERPISRPRDFSRFQGRRVRVRTRTAIDGRRNFTGTLSEFHDDRVILTVDGQTVSIPVLDIARARLADGFASAAT
jgi:ribosome maturation factor RimP